MAGNHFGDTDPEDHDGDKSRKFLNLITAAKGSAGANTFADSGYFAGVLLNQPRMTELLRTLYAASDNEILRERLMYGTDWTMILPQHNVERYLSDFMDVMARVEAAEPGVAVRQTSLSNAFFGQNAASFLGLRPGMRNRKRLEAFYAARQVPQPDWMHKLG